VPSHFDALGFPASNEAELHELLVAAFDPENPGNQGPVEHADGQSAKYRDPSGATLTTHFDRRGNLVCCQPGFEGPFHGRWRPLSVVPDQDCRFCDLVYAELLDDGDEMVYPFALTVETLGADRALVPYDEPGEVRFVGLWEEGEVWPDEAAFEQAQEAEWADVEAPEELDVPTLRGWASRSLIPSGTFGLDGGALTSHVIAHGVAESVEERRNELGGAPFKYVRLDTLGGVFDTCLAPGTAEREELLAPRAVVQAALWLVGRPLTLRDEPGPVPLFEHEQDGKEPGRLRRLFRRR
jgi:hypothetical protein